MIVNTQAVVLNYHKYTDSSIIVHCITEKLGRQAFFVYGIGSKSNKLSQFQPLYLLDLQLYVKPNRSLQKLKESKIFYPLFHISSHHVKSTIALFLSEVLAKSINEAVADNQLFAFIKTSIQILETLNDNFEVFHHIFLLKLAKLLGILPEFSSQANYIDLTDGTNLLHPPHHDNYIDKNLLQAWELLVKQNFDNLQIPPEVLASKTKILDAIVTLYELHILNFNTLKSYPVLKEVYR